MTFEGKAWCSILERYPRREKFIRIFLKFEKLSKHKIDKCINYEWWLLWLFLQDIVHSYYEIFAWSYLQDILNCLFEGKNCGMFCEKQNNSIVSKPRTN